MLHAQILSLTTQELKNPFGSSSKHVSVDNWLSIPTVVGLIENQIIFLPGKYMPYLRYLNLSSDPMAPFTSS